MFDNTIPLFKKMMEDYRFFLAKNEDAVMNAMVDKNKISMPPFQYYQTNCIKWMFKLGSIFEEIHQEELYLNKIEFNEIDFYKTYCKIQKNLKDHFINISTYHDLLLHLIAKTLKVGLTDKMISWKYLQYYTPDTIRNIVDEIYDLIKEEIQFRNKIVHDFTFDCMDSLFGNEFCLCANAFQISDYDKLYKEELKQLVQEGNAKLKIVYQYFEDELNNLEKLTFSLFDEILPIYEKFGLDNSSDRKYVKEFYEIIINISELLNQTITEDDFEIIDRGIPHTPEHLPRNCTAVYTFYCPLEKQFLKIGYVSANSDNRFFYQHYAYKSNGSVLAKSILADEDFCKKYNISESNVGAWIKSNTHRIDIIFKSSVNPFTKELIESAFHYKYMPRYEG